MQMVKSDVLLVSFVNFLVTLLVRLLMRSLLALRSLLAPMADDATAALAEHAATAEKVCMQLLKEVCRGWGVPSHREFVQKLLKVLPDTQMSA